jgi:hypothetical protein
MTRGFLFPGGPEYRTIDEPMIIEQLMLAGFGFELREGGRAAAAAAVTTALQRWVELGLGFERAPEGGRRFDPAEVVNFLKWAALSEGDPFWVETYVATGRRLAASMHRAGADLRDLPRPSDLPPMRFEVTLTRRFGLDYCGSQDRLRLRLPLPLEDAALNDLTVTAIPPVAPGTARYSQTPGRFDAVVSRTGLIDASLGVHLSFVARPSPAEPPADLAPEDQALYTQPREGLIQVCSAVKALSDRLAAGVRQPRDMLKRFWQYLIEELWCGALHYDQLPTDSPLAWILDHGWFDCQLGSALLVALCRAQGLPGRLKSGLLLYPIAPSIHHWAEIWLDGEGWVPFDLLAWDLSVRGQDTSWTDYFFGAVDARLTTQCLPRFFTGTAPISWPRYWHMLQRPLPEGMEITFIERNAGGLIIQDQVSVRRPVPA